MKSVILKALTFDSNGFFDVSYIKDFSIDVDDGFDGCGYTGSICEAHVFDLVRDQLVIAQIAASLTDNDGSDPGCFLVASIQLVEMPGAPASSMSEAA